MINGSWLLRCNLTASYFFSRTAKVFLKANVTLCFLYSYGERGAAVVSVYIHLLKRMFPSLLGFTGKARRNQGVSSCLVLTCLACVRFLESTDSVFTICLIVDPSASLHPEDRWLPKIERLWSRTETGWLWRLITADTNVSMMHSSATFLVYSQKGC